MMKIWHLKICALGLMVFIILSNALNAQITFEVNFDLETFGEFKDHPEYKVIDEDGLNPKFESMGKSWYHPAIGGRRTATSTSKFVPSGQADNWLITPKVFIPLVDPYLIWESATIFDGLEETYEILISNLDQNISNFEVINKFTDSFHSFTTHNISLQSFAGDSVFLAFRHISNDQRELSLKRIEIGKREPYAMKVKKTNLDKYVQKSKAYPVEVDLLNIGSNDINRCRLNWTIDGHDTISQWLNIPTLSWNEETQLSLSKAIIFDHTGIIKLKIWIDSINDISIPINSIDVFEQKVYPINKNIKKRVYFEEMTATWCQSCPPGNLIFQDLLEKYENLSGGSFHDNDVMTTPTMNPIINEYTSFLPGGLVDRTPDHGKNNPYRNVSLWEKGIIEQLSKNSPAELHIETSLDPISRIIDIELQADFYAESDRLYRLNIVIVEDSVTGGESYHQANAGNNNKLSPFYMKGDPIEGYVHRNVIRGLLGGAWGFKAMESGDITHIGDQISQHVRFEVPDSFDIRLITILGLIQEYNQDIFDRPILNVIETSIITSVESEISIPRLRLFPNPTTNTILIQNINFKELIAIDIVSINGKEFPIENWEFYAGALKLNLVNIPSGQHFVRLQGFLSNGQKSFIVAPFTILH